MQIFHKLYLKVFIGAVFFGLGLLLLLFTTISLWIGVDVRQQCAQAENNYAGDCVEALISLIQDDQASFRDKNSAIWALGQLGDDRALPVLRELYTGNIPEREPIDEGISQYELKKAIALAEGSFNATAFIWRHNLP